MTQFVAEASITNGRLELKNVPFENDAPVKVIVIPKANLSKMSIPEMWEATKSIKGKLTNDIDLERDER